uniref:Uncharacterized protein n=1 Tax=viral metagenome TaxID=1070528 RepID=A0A6M3LH34_9ZZZZ
MADFSSTVLGEMPFGGKRITYGTFDDSSSSAGTGDIDTGLIQVESIFLTPYGNATDTNAATVAEVFPIETGDVTIFCDAGTAGYWRAIGI